VPQRRWRQLRLNSGRDHGPRGYPPIALEAGDEPEPAKHDEPSGLLTTSQQGRTAAHGLGPRISTAAPTSPNCHAVSRVSRLSHPVDVNWTSMSLHHIADETTHAQCASLPARTFRATCRRRGRRTFAHPARRPRRRSPGLADRLVRAEWDWFASKMRAGLSGASPQLISRRQLTSAGLEVVAGERFELPLTAIGVAQHVERAQIIVILAVSCIAPTCSYLPCPGQLTSRSPHAQILRASLGVTTRTLLRLSR